jgi:DnaJ-class molecular chaperone
MEGELTFDIDIPGTGLHHSLTWLTKPCPQCEGRGRVGHPMFAPTCPTCEGRKVVPTT